MISADKVKFGAGIYGLYFALECAKRKEKVFVLEYNDGVFSRASFLNQSRIHNGYHYPRSLSTALKSALYFERFANSYPFCIQKKFKSIYSVAALNSKINKIQFENFCQSANIPFLQVENSHILLSDKYESYVENCRIYIRCSALETVFS
ncbi:MAG: NAD(P)/FAD-dependent oxidoreductase [Saprospiraceae bacterium]|nr:NAD(P)/FAD-dependent oxidoreductase [Saprospiraceae bacterium]